MRHKKCLSYHNHSRQRHYYADYNNLDPKWLLLPMASMGHMRWIVSKRHTFNLLCSVLSLGKLEPEIVLVQGFSQRRYSNLMYRHVYVGEQSTRRLLSVI